MKTKRNAFIYELKIKEVDHASFTPLVSCPLCLTLYWLRCYQYDCISVLLICKYTASMEPKYPCTSYAVSTPFLPPTIPCDIRSQ